MKIFVISLKNAAERRRESARQLAELGLEFEFFDAVSGSTDFSAYFSGYDKRLFRLNARRDPLANEVGCYASHRSVWKKCVELQEPVIVFEDDFLLLENFPDALRETQSLIDDFGFIRLQSLQRGSRRLIGSGRTSVRPVGRAGRFELNYLADVPLCTVAYAISPPAAAALVKSSAVLTAPVDKFMQWTWKHQVPVYGLSPAAVDAAPVSNESTIGARQRKSWNPGLLLPRLVFKIYARIRRLSFNRSQLKRLDV